MKRFFKSKGIVIALAVVVIALIAGIAAYNLGGRAGSLGNFVSAVTAPVEKGVSAVFEWLEQTYGYMYEYDKLKAENEELKKTIAEMEEEIRESADALDENARLRELLNLAEKRKDFDFESATVISWTASNWESSFTISKGENSGIEIGDSVVTESGALVGQVIAISSSTATVRTLIDTGTDVGALIDSTGGAAIVSGDFTLMRQGCVKLSFLPEGTTLLAGDVILTSGKGEVFPSGLVIGHVADVYLEESGLTEYAVVEPAAKLSELTQVFVIKDFDIGE